MWLAKTADGKVQQITPEWVTQGIQVFQGDFTCCNRKHEGMACCDKEKLVAPILGLLGAAYELRTVHPEIYSLLDQPNMFPEMFTLEKKTESGKVVKQVKPLFGDRVGFMKDYIDHDPAGAAHRQLVKANAKKVSSDRKARQSRLTGGPGKRVPGSTVPTMERTGLANFRGFGRGSRTGLGTGLGTGLVQVNGCSPQRSPAPLVWACQIPRSRTPLVVWCKSKPPDVAQRRSFSTASRDSDAPAI